jgi:hypothetical protein
LIHFIRPEFTEKYLPFYAELTMTHLKGCILPLIFSALLLMCIPGVSSAQNAVVETKHDDLISFRSEILENLRKAKADSLEIPRQSNVEKALLYIEENKIIDRLRFGHHHFYPNIGGLTTGSGFAWGVRYWNDALIRKSNVYWSTSWSMKGYQQYLFGVDSKSFGNIPMIIGVEGRYRNFPKEDYYGAGPASQDEDEVNYRLEDFSADAGITFELFSHIEAGVKAGYLRSRTAAGTEDETPSLEETFTLDQAPGFSRTIEHRKIGFSAILDLRDSPGNPRSGIGLFFDHTLFDDVNGSSNSFKKTSGEFQGYLPFLHKHRVIALRVRMETTDGWDGGTIPFFLQPYVGGGQSLRGYEEFRFQDRKILLANLEYRFEAFIGCDVALFGDFGQVGSHWDNFRLSEFKYSYGGGFRFNTAQSVFLRLDVGHGKEGTRTFFKFGNVF